VKAGDLVRFSDWELLEMEKDVALVLKVYRGIPDGSKKPTKLCDIVWQSGAKCGAVVEGFYACEFEVLSESR